VDVQEIFHRKEPRDLPAAVQFYCGSEHAKAHSALEDARACWRVLKAQVLRYEDLPCNIEELAKFCLPTHGRFLDSGRWFEPRDGEPTFARGKHAGRSLAAVAREERDYLIWLLGLEDVPADTKHLAQRALSRGQR